MLAELNQWVCLSRTQQPGLLLPHPSSLRTIFPGTLLLNLGVSKSPSLLDWGSANWENWEQTVSLNCQLISSSLTCNWEHSPRTLAGLG